MARRTYAFGIHEIHIRASPREVFDYVADLTHHGEWSPFLLRITAVTPGPVGVGSQYRSKGRMYGWTKRGQLRVTEHDPPRRFAFVARHWEGEYRHEFSMEPHDGGTLVQRRTTAVWPSWKAGVAWVVSSLLLPRSNMRSLDALKARLENPVRGDR